MSVAAENLALQRKRLFELTNQTLDLVRKTGLRIQHLTDTPLAGARMDQALRVTLSAQGIEWADPSPNIGLAKKDLISVVKEGNSLIASKEPSFDTEDA